MPTLKDVTAVIVTRGDVDLAPIHASLAAFNYTIVWNNHRDPDVAVYGRYCATRCSLSDLIYLQDDDCIVTGQQALLDAWRPGVIVTNMPEAHRFKYPDRIALVGFGALFDRALIEPAFRRYFTHWPEDRLFHLECDRVFTALNEVVRIELPYRNLPHAEAPDRLWRLPDHIVRLRMIEQRIKTVLGGPA